MNEGGARSGYAVACLVAAFLYGGCVPTAMRQFPTAAARLDGGWQTLRGEHRITVEVGGQAYRLRAVVAIARPDRVRLRALGPGGITLFDVLAVRREVTVLRALPRMSTSVLFPLIDTIVDDLTAVYDLGPRPSDRTIEVKRGWMLIREPQRELHLTRFRAIAGKVYPSRIEIVNRRRGYRVRVDAAATWLDVPLDAALFMRSAVPDAR